MNFDDVKKAARKHIQGISATSDMLAFPGAFISKEAQSKNLASLLGSLDISSARTTHQLFEVLTVLNVYLTVNHDKVHETSDQDAAIFLRKWVAGAILPTEAFAELSPYSIKEKQTLDAGGAAEFRAISLSGIQLLARLQRMKPLSEDEHVVTILTCLASFTNLDDLWTCSEAREHAHVLSEEYAACKGKSTLLTGILQERIKPLFAKQKNPAVTQQGRKAIGPLSSAATACSDLDDEANPWKYRDPYIVTVFQWVLEHLDESSLHSNWPSIVPPLLALIDDSAIKYKVKGCNSLAIFLHMCPSILLERTGLGDIFENAVTPCLLSLPSLTEETESLQMLTVAYPTLIALALARFPGVKHQTAKIRALDQILRNGILKGYVHAGEHVRIGKLLVDEMAVLVKELAIESVKHIKVSSELLQVGFG